MNILRFLGLYYCELIQNLHDQEVFLKFCAFQPTLLFNLTFTMKKPVVRSEIFNFKKIDSQKKFQNVTSFSNQFGDWLNPKFSAEQNTRKYFKNLMILCTSVLGK